MRWNGEKVFTLATVGVLDGVFGGHQQHAVPLLGVLLGLPLQAVWNRRGKSSNTLDGVVDGSSALLGRAIGEHGAPAPVAGAYAVRGYAAGYREIPRHTL